MTHTTALSPRILQPGDIDPNWRWDKHIPALGHTAVDFERRVDHDRLRRYRLSRAKDALKSSHCGSLLMFDVNNIRNLMSGISAPRQFTIGSIVTGWTPIGCWLVLSECGAQSRQALA
jgi:hypothetical protein